MNMIKTAVRIFSASVRGLFGFFIGVGCSVEIVEAFYPPQPEWLTWISFAQDILLGVAGVWCWCMIHAWVEQHWPRQSSRRGWLVVMFPKNGRGNN